MPSAATAEARAAGEWADRFRQLSDADPVIQAHGKYFSCSYLLDFQQLQMLVRMHGGRAEQVLVDPPPLEAYDFAIRGDVELWRKFCQPTPPAMYHGLWSATFRSGMRIEGNILTLMQNLMCMTRQMELLRTTGSPV